ncbi:MAG: DUF3352 domain-containing protein [Thermoleophilaceae bacterium]
MTRALSACAVVLAIAVAGCGSTTGSGPVDPATLAPATTLAYASFELAPQGAEKQGFDAAFGKLLGADPERRLGEAFTNAVQTSGRLGYDADVKPWLGETATAIVTSIGNERPDYALLVASTDDDKARAAIDKDLADAHAASRDYRGVAYKIMDDGTANGVVDHFLVAGTEAAFKSVVDTGKDGKSLAVSEQWKTSVGNRGDGKVGLGYVDVKGLLQSFASKLPGAQRLAAPLLLGLVQIHPFVATLDANADSLVADVSSPGTKPDPRGPGAASSPLIEGLPADSWAALALPKVGQALGTLATALKVSPLIGAQYERVVAQVRANTGLDLEKDVFAAIGDVGVFARGSSPATVGGALVVESPQPATLAKTVRRLPALIRGAGHAEVRVVGRGARGFDVTAAHAPKPVEVRVSGDGAVAAYGAAALRAARHPSGRLGGTPLFRAAAAAVGERPTFFLDFGPALRLAAASPHHRNDKDFQRALPHLQALEYLAVGARREGKLDVLRAALGLR